jgi:hypothetical protein
MSFTDDLEKLGEAEVRRRLQNEGFGQPGSQNYSSVQEWLSAKKREREDALNARREAREEESLSISRKALRISKWAMIIAIAAIVFSTITAIFIAVIEKR